MSFGCYWSEEQSHWRILGQMTKRPNVHLPKLLLVVMFCIEQENKDKLKNR